MDSHLLSAESQGPSQSVDTPLLIQTGTISKLKNAHDRLFQSEIQDPISPDYLVNNGNVMKELKETKATTLID